MPKSSYYVSTLDHIWRLCAIIAFIVGIILAIGGVVVAIIGHRAQTTLNLLGQEVSTTSVGVALAFMGAITVILLIRRVLDSVEFSMSYDNMMVEEAEYPTMSAKEQKLYRRMSSREKVAYLSMSPEERKQCTNMSCVKRKMLLLKRWYMLG